MPDNQGPDPRENRPDFAPSHTDHDTTPPADRRMQALAGFFLLLPLIGLMWVGSYAKVEPKLGAFPFFFWYQFVWVFLTSACTYIAYRLVLKARPHRPMRGRVNPDALARR